MAVTPRAVSATSVTLLASASARSVPTPALHEAPNHGQAGHRAFRAAQPPGLSLWPARLPHGVRPCPTAWGLEVSGSIQWELGPQPGGSRGPPRTPGNGWEDCPQRLPAVQETHPGSPPAFLSVLQAQVEGLTCSQCRPHHFHLSASNPDGCLPCFCMGVTQQCSSSSYTRQLVGARTRP